MLVRKLCVLSRYVSSSSSSSSLKSLSLLKYQRSLSSITKDKNDNYDSLKDETLCQYSGLPALNQYLDDATTTTPPTTNTTLNNITNDSIINSDESLQGHWKSLEKRVQSRKLRQKVAGRPDGRGPVRVTGWDAENV